MQHSPTRVQVALVLLLGLLWGLNWPTVKIALAEIGPWTLRASALCIAAISLVAFTWARGGALSISNNDSKSRLGGFERCARGHWVRVFQQYRQ
jgi:drug/metabolite transporter (DMT)-like permease